MRDNCKHPESVVCGGCNECGKYFCSKDPEKPCTDCDDCLEISKVEPVDLFMCCNCNHKPASGQDSEECCSCELARLARLRLVDNMLMAMQEIVENWDAIGFNRLKGYPLGKSFDEVMFELDEFFKGES